MVQGVPYTVFSIMMAHTDEAQLAFQICQQYCDLMDNHRDQLSLYLSDDVILHWFGRTICGKDHVTSFFNQEVANTTHKLASVEPADSVQIRNKIRKEVSSCTRYLQDCGSSQERCIKSFKNLSVNDGVPSSAFSSEITVQHQGNGVVDIQPSHNKSLKASGVIQFCRTRLSPSSHKNLKLATDTMKWERYCKMNVAYSFFQSQGEFRNFELKQMLYEDSTRCKRNLAPEFDKLVQ